MADWSSYIDDKEECPTCGKICESELGVQIHHADYHGERLRETRNCVFCGDEFEVPGNNLDQKYCSRRCSSRSRSQEQKAKRPRNNCVNCGRLFRVKPSKEEIRKYCSAKCSTEARRDRVEVTCAECGDVFDVASGEASDRMFCSKDCVHSAQQSRTELECVECGSLFEVTPFQASQRVFCSADCVHENLREDQDNVPRRGVFWENQREMCLSRDDYTCQACGEQRRELQVHHIIPARHFDRGEEQTAHSLSNLVSLCPECHGKWEGLFLRPDTCRDYWAGEETA